MSLIYELSSTFDDIPLATREWRIYQKEHYRCKVQQCQKLDSKRIYPKPVDLTIDGISWGKTEPIVIGVFYGCSDLFHINFIDQIRSYMEGFIFGKCFLSDGSQLNNYVTCYSKDTILIRGSQGTVYNECSQCMSVSCTPKEPRYTLKMYLKGCGVYQDAIHTLYLDESLVDKIDFSPWPDVVLEPIEVRDEPVDQRRLICDPPNPSWKYDK